MEKPEPKSEQKYMRSPNSPSLRSERDTFYSSLSNENEWKQLSTKFKNVPLAIVRKNPEICAAVISTVLENTDLDGFILKMSRNDFEKNLKSKIKADVRPSFHETNRKSIGKFIENSLILEASKKNIDLAKKNSDPLERQSGCCHKCIIF